MRGERRLCPGLRQKESISLALDRRNLKKLTPLKRHVWLMLSSTK
jgi:hypothetical protein